MASKLTNSLLPSIITISLLLFCISSVQCVELEVGGGSGWATPPAKNEQSYNDWASSNRFKVNDTLRFQYQKDSVLVVTEEEYEKCRASHPMFFSNNGDTLFTLDRPGLFYFISGVSGHCERGLKMIVKVLELDSPPQTANRDAGSPSSSGFATSGFIPGSAFVLISSLVGTIFA